MGEGVKTVDEMKRRLRQFVKSELFPGQTPPPIANRRYYPTDVDVRNHIYKASVKKMLSKVDQENLEKKIEYWHQEHPPDTFYFRPRALSISPNAERKSDESRRKLWAGSGTFVCTPKSLAETTSEILWK